MCIPLRDRLMVGHSSLKAVILVRVQVPQQINYESLSIYNVFIANIVWGNTSIFARPCNLGEHKKK